VVNASVKVGGCLEIKHLCIKLASLYVHVLQCGLICEHQTLNGYQYYNIPRSLIHSYAAMSPNTRSICGLFRWLPINNVLLFLSEIFSCHLSDHLISSFNCRWRSLQSLALPRTEYSLMSSAYSLDRTYTVTNHQNVGNIIYAKQEKQRPTKTSYRIYICQRPVINVKANFCA